VTHSDDPARLWGAALARFGPGAVLVLSHDDADGLSSAALLLRALARAGREAVPRLVGRFESAWNGPLAPDAPGSDGWGGVVIADLGLGERLPHPGVPTLVIDHHVPRGAGGGATVISGAGLDPSPNTSLLVHRAVGAPPEEGWITALGIIGDNNEAAGFPEMAEARARFRVTHLRDAAALVNAPRRSARPDARPALELILKSDGPADLLSGRHPETAILQAAREEVKGESERARKVAPLVSGNVALLRLHSACQVHPLAAQSWARRLQPKVVIAANTGFRPGYVHFAARGGARDLVQFFRERAPEGAGDSYGGGHPGASGGALPVAVWDPFIRALGFGPEAEAARFPVHMEELA
jgi:single-stranded-DNA-specific exonuclease